MITDTELFESINTKKIVKSNKNKLRNVNFILNLIYCPNDKFYVQE